MASAAAADLLPRHVLPFEKPPQSELITLSEGEKAYGWKLTPSERSHVAEMLNVDSKASFERYETLAYLH
jgi:hypothetical protein